MAEKILKAEKRELGTKGDMNQLRKDGFVPGVYYSKGKDQIIFSVEEKVLNKLVFTSETSIIQLSIENEEPIGCIIKDIQFDPVTDRVVHIDMIGITLGQVMIVEIPISVVGTSVGVKEGGVLQVQLHKLEIECLPRHIPQNLEIDITELNIGDSIHVRDLEFENVKILNNEEATVLSIAQPKLEEVEEEEDDVDAVDGEVAEPEVISKGKSEEE